MLSVASGDAVHSWLDLIPGIHDWGRGLGSTWLKGEVVSVIHVILAVLAVAVASILILRASRNFSAHAEARLSPRTFFELVLDALLGMLSEQMGRKNAERFLPLIASLAVFIFFCNVMALIPGLLPPTDNLNTTAAPALVVFVTTHVVGVKEHGFAKYFGHFLGPIRAWYALPLMALMLPIELIGHFARPLSLSLRLLGNMFGDHAVLAIFLGMLPFVLPLPLMVLGMIVVIVQTMVFCILSTIYFAMAVAHEEH